MKIPVLGLCSMATAGLAVLPFRRADAQVPPSRPKLVVVIVIDQLRHEYLERFRSHFTKGGFNRFRQQGAYFTGAKYQHAITSTCPGHAVILTGSYGRVNGIVGNDWYDAAAGHEVYCAADTTVNLIGVSGEGRSPRNLIGFTVGDELSLANNGRSHIVTVAGKDRSAIMLGGHLADAAYWTDDTLFVSSTYYMKELPAWVRRFNSSGVMTAYSGKSWERLLAPAAYASVGPDDMAGEENVEGRGRTFPHTLPASSPASRFATSLEYSPFHNEVIAEFAMRAIQAESLGTDAQPDLLAIGFSALDRVGHAYGPHSHEVMDLLVRTDRLLERLFLFLDRRVGLGSTLIVLTADHGVAPLPEVVRRIRPGVATGRVKPAIILSAVRAGLEAKYGAVQDPGWVLHHAPPMLYLNVRALQAKGISLSEAERVAKLAVQGVPGVREALTATEMWQQRIQNVMSASALSFYPGRSGNLYYELQPYHVLGEEPTGADHGSPWTYDAHVPLLWFGTGVAPGRHTEEVSIADIAPTLALILGIAQPGGTGGRVLGQVLR
jgi:predicted AlkP superfamily pyrophosphatase or phosphodiesterase